MKFKIKTIITSLLVVACFWGLTPTNAFADGPPYQEIEPSNSASNANQIVLYDAVNGTLPKGDIDYYKIYIPTNDTYSFWFGVTNGTQTVTVSISDSNNNIVFQGNPDNIGHIGFEGKLQGLYYVAIKDDQNVSNNNQYNFEFYPKDWKYSQISRFSGNDRYGTSFDIFKNNWASCDYAVIATGEQFPDALSASPLAKKYNAPIILTRLNELSVDAENQLKKTGVKNVFLIGGEGVVSKGVEDKLKSMGITCTRIYGEDRYGTSLAIAKYLNPKGEVAIATGENFPDALSIASIAASSEMPILLVNKDKVSDNVAKYIKDSKITNSYIIGGEGVISPGCENYLSQFTTVKRLAGTNRYETNIAVLTYFEARLRLHDMFYATGRDFPDALSGSVIAAAGNHPIVLADVNPDICTIRYCVKNAPRGKIVFGGQAVLPDSVINSITK
jgi:putative cell wall-binding protein